jgi:serine/threonine protein kinase/class 3 adenylate cyclase
MSDKTQGSLGLLLRERARIDAELRRHQAEVAILFTDVVGSTAYYDRFGNTAGILLMQRHDDITKTALAKFDGRWIKSTGDGAMAEFIDAVQAVRAAVTMQRQLFERNQRLPESERCQLRVGINYGEVVRKGDDVWGNAVNVAARVCGKCEPAQILISSSVHALLPGDFDIRVVSLGRIELKGKQSREELLEVVWTDSGVYQNLRQDLTKQLATGRLFKKESVAIGGADMPAVGGHFAGRYEILQELGVGGMGVVYKVHDQETGEVLALKVLRTDIASDAVAMERFKNELRVARRITHPKVCRVHEFGRASGTAYISMELVEGHNLHEIQAQRGRLEPSGHGCLPLTESLRIALDLCDALGEVHRQGAVHRDLKPSNVMVTDTQDVKLMDFGISGFGNTGLTVTGMAMGTPRYMAPEQVAQKPIDGRTDIYNFGLTLFEMLTGRPAFDGDTMLAVAMKQLHSDPPNPRQLQPSIPAEVEQIIMRCLRKDPARRYRSMSDIATELRRVGNTTGLTMALPSLGLSDNRTAPNAVDPGDIQVNPKDGQNYVWIPPGVYFRGGSPKDPEASVSESPRHEVTISNGFWAGQTPVTIGAYRRFAAEAQIALPKELQPTWTDQCPIVGISWNQAMSYCKWAGGRLLTDAEWEYAARAGYPGPRYGDPNKIAWFRVTPPGPRPVRGKEANAWGLYDTLGNVWEWCSDWFEEYQEEAQVDPVGPPVGEFKIIRGGSWDDHPRVARLSVRSWQTPDYRSTACGFRCVIDSLMPPNRPSA